jgi:hypothetical protein
VISSARCIDEGGYKEMYTKCETSTQMVYIRRAFIGKTRQVEPDFCSNPQHNASADWVSHEDMLSIDMGRSCNLIGKCTARFSWYAPQCDSDYQGQNFVYLEYECLESKKCLLFLLSFHNKFVLPSFQNSTAKAMLFHTSTHTQTPISMIYMKLLSCWAIIIWTGAPRRPTISQ